MTARVPGRIAALAGAVWLALAGCGGDVPIPNARVAAGPLEITLVAQGIAFDPVGVAAPAGVPLRVILDNRDPGVPHNIRLMAGPGFSIEVAKSEIVVGPAELAPMILPGLVPGAYRFICEVHPIMVTDLKVDPGG